MKVLLVNPNRYCAPPVIPLGLEYLVANLRHNGHNARILDLCFTPDPLTALKAELDLVTYDLVGITVRNIDTVLFFNNETFLDDIRAMVAEIKTHKVPVVVGGTGFSALPHATLNYLGAHFGIIGPGENAIVQLAGDIEGSTVNYQIINGWEVGFNPTIIPERGVDVDYPTYLANGGIIGFETQKGCPNRCSYCIEAGHQVQQRPVPIVIQELASLVERGFQQFHLCDSEFNFDLPYCKDFLQALIAQQWDLHWTAYLVPNRYDEDLFHLLAESHVDLLTLSVCSDPAEQARVGYSYDNLGEIIALCGQFGIPLAIDLLVGFPNESQDSIEKIIAFFQENRPHSVGVNFYFRLYPRTTLTKRVISDKKLRKMLTRPLSSHETFIQPVFFAQLDLANVRFLLQNDPLFKIEGFEKSVNYQR